jgi:predicted ester cyclase
MAVDIKQVSRKILEDVFAMGKVDYLDQVCDASFKSHDPLTGDSDLAGLKRDVQTYRSAFPDLSGTVLGLCAEGDTVCMHWRMTGTHQKAFLGIEPTGKRLSVDGISFDRYRNGKLVESFSQWDTLKFLQGLGVIPEISLTKGKIVAPERRPHA